MADPVQPAERVAVRVADGGRVDWDEVERSASDEIERRVIRHLRLVESVARAHRSASLPGPGGAARDRAMSGWAHLELRAKLGEGAFGEVWRAWDPRLEREVALKLLRVDRSHEERLASTVVEEGRVLAKLRHPNVVTVYGAEVHAARVGLWMELVHGRSLAQVLADHGPFGAREAALVGIELCRALGAVHRTGIVHRDVKAQNVMREEGGRIVLMDFGLGVETAGPRSPGSAPICGTPLYMAPETLRGQPSSQQSDLYALGVLLYHLVTGSFPLDAGSPREILERHARGEVKLLRDRRSDLPEAYLRVVERALSADPEQRYATAGQMEQALAASLGVESDPAASGPTPSPAVVPSRPPRGAGRWLAAAALALVLLAAIGTAVYTLRPTTEDPRLAPYRIEVGLYRVSAASTARERIESGARLTLGDQLQLDVESSTSLYVYVISEDEEGRAYVLFPLSGLEPSNPLPGDRTHRLPGSRDGEEQRWVVDTPGGREHLLVLASPTRLLEFEADMNSLERPGEPAIELSESAKIRLRGIGGLATAPEASSGTSATRLFEMADRLALGSEITTGVWLRRIELENPGPAGAP